jgi:hypothetical protein
MESYVILDYLRRPDRICASPHCSLLFSAKLTKSYPYHPPLPRLVFAKAQIQVAPGGHLRLEPLAMVYYKEALIHRIG